MDRIEKWMFDKYFDSDYEKCKKLMSLYWGIKNVSVFEILMES